MMKLILKPELRGHPLEQSTDPQINLHSGGKQPRPGQSQQSLPCFSEPSQLPVSSSWEMNHSCQPVHVSDCDQQHYPFSPSASPGFPREGAALLQAPLASVYSMPGPWASLLLASSSTIAPGTSKGLERKRTWILQGLNEKRKCRARADPTHLHSLISGDQLCSLHPTDLAVRFSLCSGMPGMLPDCALLFLQEGPALPRTSATPSHLPGQHPAPHLMSWHSQTVAKVPHPSLCSTWYRAFSTSPSCTGW